MKKNLLSLIWSAALSAPVLFNLTACSEDNSPAEETFGETIFEVEPIIFEGIAGEQQADINFVAGAHWTATFTSSNNWIEASPTQGEAGSATIHVTPYNDNKSSTERKAQLMILVDGEETPYTVSITQKSAAQSDLEISGDVNEGVMTLTADETGNKFTGTLLITSSSKWDISTQDGNMLTFGKSDTPEDGKEKEIELTVTADYNSFTNNELSASFDLTVPGTTPITIDVKATANCKVYELDTKTENEAERLKYEFVDTLTSGTFQLTFYVESNIAWELKNLPDWMEIAGGQEIATNRKADGTLHPRRVGVGLLVKSEALSVAARNASINLTNSRGEVLRTLDVEFKGIGNNFLEHDFVFPLYDNSGNEFLFEANESYFDPESQDDYGKTMELAFNIKTSLDYTTIDNAPYHLIMCKSDNGFIRKEEVHWATLRMGDEANNISQNGVYTKEVYLKANNRGDADDQNGVTTQTAIREAFIFIVPKSVTFDDLFEGETLKEEYEEKYSHIMQKQDHKVEYILKLDGLANGDVVNVPVSGETYSYPILEASTMQLTANLKRLWYNSTTTEWEEKEPTSAQRNQFTIEYKNGNLILSVAANTTNKERRMRFYIDAFRGDSYGDVTVLTFDVIQAGE